jgi:hypothetical protein
MYITSRSYLTAGIAALGVGAIALTPIQPIATPDQDRVTRSLAAVLAAETTMTPIDPITPWVDTIETSVANIGALFDFYFSNPGGYTSPLGLEGPGQAVFPLLQTVIANQITYFQELGSGNAGLIPEQILGNVQTFFNAPWSPGDPAGTYVSGTTVASLAGLPLSQQSIFALLPTVLGFTPEEWDASPLKPVVNFTATYYSGQVVGLLGPLLAPVIELTRSFTAIGAFFEAGDVTGAINELINIPANVTNAVLNGGGVLDLTGVVNAISPLPPEVESIGLNLGGLISPPVPQNGSLLPDGTAPTQFDGGVLFDSLAANINYKVSNLPPPNGTFVKVQDPGIPVSWIGAAVGLGQFLGQEMVVTPPPAPTTAAAVSDAVEVAAPVDEAPAIEAPVDEAPVDEHFAPVDNPVDEAPAIEAPADELEVDDVVAEDVAEDEAAAAVEAPEPKSAASVGSDDAGDTGSRASDSRRGASDAD